MDKKDLKQDLIKEKLIDYINYIAEHKGFLFQGTIIVCILIGAYSFFSISKADKEKHAAELAGLAQSEYNKEISDVIISDLQDVLDSYEKTPGAVQSYIYLIYHSYINNDIDKLNRLLEDYSVNLSDPLLTSSVLETKANIFMNNEDYTKAIESLNKALKTKNIHSLKARFNISKARVYILEGKYEKAKNILNKIKNDNNITSQQINTIEELLSYISHM